jgi:endoglucanase
LDSFLAQLLAAPGLTGHEAPARALVRAAWEPLVDEIQVSRVGSLAGVRRGPSGAPRLLLAAHMDAIGLVAVAVWQGFIRVAPIGGVDPRVLPGQRVLVYGRETLPGVVALPPPHLLPEGAGKAPEIAHLLVDVGLPEAEVSRLVRPGDPIAFAQEPLAMGEGWMLGHSLDNRASVAALTYALELLRGRDLPCELWAVATVQEEETMAGSLTAAFQLQPQAAIAIDVTFGQGPGTPAHQAFPLDGGVTLGWGANIHPALYRRCRDLATQLEIPAVMEPMPASSGTDALGLQIAGPGVPSMVISLPIRYMHTPVEVVAERDIRRVGRLLAEFAANFDAAAAVIRWEEDVDL